MAKKSSKPKAEPKPKKCQHPGYRIVDGELVCEVCGEPSPRARLVDGNIVPIPKTVKCPECGHEFEVGR